MTSLFLLPSATWAADEPCANRGTLDPLYCDADENLTADPPKDKSKWKNPSTLVFTYTPVEGPAVYRKIFQPFLVLLTKVAVTAIRKRVL